MHDKHEGSCCPPRASAGQQVANRSSSVARRTTVNICTRNSDCDGLGRLFLLILEVPPETHQLSQFRPEAQRWVLEPSLISIRDGPLPDQIGLVRADKLGLVPQLPAEEKDGREYHHGVVGEEGRNVPRREAAVAVEDDDEGLEHQSDVGTVRLEITVVGEGLAVDALGDAGAVEEDVGKRHDYVVDDAAGGDEVDKPGQDDVGARGELQEGQEGEAHDHYEAVDGHALVGHLAQEAGGAALERHAVQVAHGGIGIRVAGREYRGDHQRVCDVGQDSDAQVVPGKVLRISGVYQAAGLKWR